MNAFTINNKVYNAKPFDFNTVCDLEDMGIELDKLQEKPMSAARAYFALCTGRGKDFAGAELNAHIVNGGDFKNLIQIMNAELEKSDFFQALHQREEENAQTETEKQK